MFSLATGLAAPLVALADNANITFYGKINVDVESVKSDIVTTPATHYDRYTKESGIDCAIQDRQERSGGCLRKE